MNDKIKSCSFIELSDIVPAEWRDWFYTAISENAPFSWGDNNRTLVTASSLYDHIDDALFDAEEVHDEEGENTKEYNQFLSMLAGLGETYIDLEN